MLLYIIYYLLYTTYYILFTVLYIIYIFKDIFLGFYAETIFMTILLGLVTIE